MTEQEKHLLLTDLCARLLYGTICYDIYGNSGILFDLAPELNSVTLKISELGSTWTTGIDKVKPYLRSISSMTEEEEKEYAKIIVKSQDCSLENNESATTMVNDWLLSKGFDVRGLIPRGLAIEASKEMYT